MYYKVIDDVISEDYQKYIQSVIYDMMWAYKSTLSANTPLGEEENFVNVPGFSKVFYNQEGVQNQLLYNTAMPLAHICCSKINVDIETIYYGRSFLQVPLQDKSGLSNPHDHLVCYIMFLILMEILYFLIRNLIVKKDLLLKIIKSLIE